MSKYKAQTGNTQRLSLGESTGAKVQPSKRLAGQTSKGKSIRYMQTTRKPSLSTSKTDNTASTTPTTPKITEKTRQHAVLLKVALNNLRKDGLIKRYEVRSKEDSTKILRVRYEFDLDLWTEDLELK